MQIHLDPNSLESYRLFLRIKQLPKYRIVGRVAHFPDEYAHLLSVKPPRGRHSSPYIAPEWMFDYQAAITGLAIRKKKFAVFAEPGLGKTGIMLDFCLHASRRLPRNRCVLMVSPLMVVRQTLAEAERFYGGKYPVEQVKATDLRNWLINGKGKIGITNYEAIKGDLVQGRLGAMALDESSSIKSTGGKWSSRIIELGKGLEWKLSMTGTPAPNDRIEYANQAVFLDAFPTTNSFLARFFVNRGQTAERWELKPHALRPFYSALSHFSIFLTNPATYGWKDNVGNIPPIHTYFHDVELTDYQQSLAYASTGTLYADHLGGITSRSVLSQIAKGSYKGRPIETHKPEFIRSLVDSWPEESTIIWCIYNNEQKLLEKVFPNAASLKGTTPYEDRETLLNDFKAGRRKVCISKSKVLGFGMNLQCATRQVFSGVDDSYEKYYQCVKRSNRVGSTRPLNIHIPLTELERPMAENVLRKAGRVQQDTEIQEKLFKESGYVSF